MLVILFCVLMSAFFLIFFKIKEQKSKAVSNLIIFFKTLKDAHLNQSYISPQYRKYHMLGSIFRFSPKSKRL